MSNIGKELEKRLEEAGIMIPYELRETGSRNAYLRINTYDAGACLHMLCALEGAIRSIRWLDLPKEVKSDLREFIKLKKV